MVQHDGGRGHLRPTAPPAGVGTPVLSVGDPRHLPDGQRGPGPPHGYGRDGGHHKDDETFSVLWTAYQPDLRAFCQDWEADRTRYGDIHTFEARPPEAGQGLFNISAVPWASFRSLHLELPEANDYLLPIFTLGRYRKENGRTLLPLAMQVHHGVTDGFHVGRFFNRLQAWADSAPEMGA